MARVLIDCRSTGMGAYTSAGGKVVNRSKTGNHWVEVIEGEVGTEFDLMDISNSGKHNCRRYRIDGEDKYSIIKDYSNNYICAFCEEIWQVKF